jgi:hypothetical protein
MVLIDNGFGTSANVGQNPSSSVIGDEQWGILRNIKFYGETEAKDCPSQNFCNSSWGFGCVDKNALMPSNFANHAKSPMISTTPTWP